MSALDVATIRRLLWPERRRLAGAPNRPHWRGTVDDAPVVIYYGGQGLRESDIGWIVRRARAQYATSLPRLP